MTIFGRVNIPKFGRDEAIEFGLLKKYRSILHAQIVLANTMLCFTASLVL